MDYTLGDVLREVNNLRFYEFSLPPLEKLPKGQCTLAANCVIAKCFSACAYTDGSHLYSNLGTIELPSIIVNFIMDFDNGEWPSLIEKNVPSIHSTTNIDSETHSVVGS